VNKKEAEMQVVFKHWIQAKWNNGSAAFELKRTLTNRFYIPNLQEHQVAALKQSFDATLYYKIPDDSRGTKPFDCFVLQQSMAYVVIGFGKSLTGWYIIPIWVWLEKSKKKTSVTSEEVAAWKDVEYVKIPKKQ
jgi:hypothetical protein